MYEVEERKLLGPGLKYAVKKMICQSAEQEEEAAKEIKVLSKIKSPNVIQLLGHSTEKIKSQSHVYLLLPLCNTSLQAVIEKTVSSKLDCAIDSDSSLISILLGAARGLKAVHDAGYRHADFKAANILLQLKEAPEDTSKASAILSKVKGKERQTHYNFEGCVPLLTDFGSTTSLVDTINSRQDALRVQDYAAVHTSAPIRAPELFEPVHPSIINGKADTWAFGCLIYNLLFGHTPFETPSQGFSSLAVISGKFTVPSGNVSWHPDLISLIGSCLSIEQRLSIEELLLRIEQLSNKSLRTAVAKAANTDVVSPSMPNRSSVKETTSEISVFKAGDFANFANFSDTTLSNEANNSVNKNNCNNNVVSNSNISTNSDDADDFGDFETAQVSSPTSTEAKQQSRLTCGFKSPNLVDRQKYLLSFLKRVRSMLKYLSDPSKGVDVVGGGTGVMERTGSTLSGSKSQLKPVRFIFIVYFYFVFCFHLIRAFINIYIYIFILILLYK